MQLPAQRIALAALQLANELARQTAQIGGEAAQRAAVDLALAAQAGQRPVDVDASGQRRGPHGGRQRRGRGRGRLLARPCAGSHVRTTGQPPQDGHQMVQIEGLADVVVHADRQAGLAVGGHDIGGHRDNGQRQLLQVLADAGGRGIAVHHRHLQVHQHDVERRIGRRHRLNREQAVVGQLHLRAFVLKQFTRHLLVVGVVFHHQQPQACQALSGRR